MFAKLLAGTPIAADERELEHLASLHIREQVAVVTLLKAGEINTVEEALSSWSERREAHKRALERRKQFRLARHDEAEQGDEQFH